MSIPAVVTITQTVITLVANTSTSLLAANSSRNYLAICNIGTGLASLAFGATAVVGQGWPLGPAPVAGDQGGAWLMEDLAISRQAINAISAAGTTIVILEGV